MTLFCEARKGGVGEEDGTTFDLLILREVQQEIKKKRIETSIVEVQ